jgi:uncharacterized protein (TIGR03437 family)
LELGAAGDTLQHTTIANNNIVLPMPGAGGIAMNLGTGLGSTGNQTLDTLIANNAISGPLPQFGIRLATGVGSASGNLIDGVQMIGNQILITSQPGGSDPRLLGINLVSGDAASDDQYPSLRPIQYSENDIARNIGILSNTINVINGIAVDIQAACCGNSNNTIGNLSILGNSMTSNVQINGAASGGYFSRPSTGNSLSNVLVQANSIQVSMPPGNFSLDNAVFSAGIQVWAGLEEPGNSVNGVSIANNYVNTPFIGIDVIGGLAIPTEPNEPPSPADNNVVSAAQVDCNLVEQAPSYGVTPSSGIKGITVAAGFGALESSGNQVQVSVVDNLVAGVLGDASLFANLESGASGNTLSTSSSLTPAISLVANAEGESPVIAPNTWIEIKGVDLAPRQDALTLRIWGAADFVNNQMPVQLDGVSVTVNGKNAYVYYVSPSQVNVLTPPDALSGPVNVVLTNNGALSQTYVAQAQALSPSFFVFDGTHVVGVHLDGTDIGPASLYPGLTTPATPAETIVLFANGFGITSTPVVSGAVSQSGSLSPLPVITIGGIQANVRFAGLNIAPGEFQFNVDVPSNVPDGDQPITATYNGVTTQAGALLAVQH